MLVMASSARAAVPLSASRGTLTALAAAGLAFGLVDAAIILDSDRVDDRGFVVAVGLLVGWSFIGTGLFAWWRRPGNRTGALMAAAGFAWFCDGLSYSNDDAVFTAGIALDALFPAFAAHLLLAFPTGRLGSRAERVIVGAGYFVVTVLQVPSLLFEERAWRPAQPARGRVRPGPLRPARRRAGRRRARGHCGRPGAARGALARRGAGEADRGRAGAVDRRQRGRGLRGRDRLRCVGSTQDALERLGQVLFATVPFGFLAGLLRGRLAEADAVSSLVARLGQAPKPDVLRAALADALGDPSLALAYWLPEQGRFVDAAGHRLELPDAGWTEVELQGRRIGALVHHPALAEQPQLVRTAGAAAALALENQRLSAELRARIEELRASRARLVEAGDAERRRLERDLHDGAQSRLVALALKLRLARMQAEPGSRAAMLLEESSAELQASLDELRKLARGIHSAVLTDRGLATALRALADRAAVPVEIEGVPSEPLPPAAETAVYFVVAEALTNVAKYARAQTATVTLTLTAGEVAVEVADDGVGGADAASGSGLRGLSDRVAALDGRLELTSPPGGGTRVRARIPP
jgi:signal transduction histidine kinase